MTLAFQIRYLSLARRVNYAWHYGELPVGIVRLAGGALLLMLAISLWWGLCLHSQTGHLESRAANLQSEIDAKSSAVQAAQPPDFAQTLPASPSVAQVMQTLQQAAVTEGARVESLQADDHPPTDTALGHLDLVLSIKAPYPSILAVLQQVLDRYPGATLRQLNLAHVAAPTTMTPVAPAPLVGQTALPLTTESEAHVLLSFWRRPAGVGQMTDLAVRATGASGVPGSAHTMALTERPAAANRAASSTVLPASGAR